MIANKKIKIGDETYLIKSYTVEMLAEHKENIKEYNGMFMAMLDFCERAVKDVFPLYREEGGKIKYGEDCVLSDFITESKMDVLLKLTDFIKKISFLTEEQDSFVRDYIRFGYFLSENDKIKDKWTCEYCIRNKLLEKRKCKRFDEDTKRKIIHEDFVPENINIEKTEQLKKRDKLDKVEENNAKLIEEFLNKRSAKRRRERQRANEGKSSTTDRPTAHALKTEFFTFEVCPLSILGYDELHYDLSIALSVEGMNLIEGPYSKQPIRFVSIKNTEKSVKNEVEKKHREKIDSDKNNKNKPRKKR